MNERIVHKTAARGFTLIELLVVVAIIGVLASVVLASLTDARTKARDTSRLSHMDQIQKMIISYRLDNDAWPARTSDSCNDGWDVTPCGGDTTFIEPLVTGGYFSTVPTDPVGTGNMIYRYYVYSAGSYGCDATFGDYFVLGVGDMESSARPHPDSPGWSCSGRNWANEFDWVVGGFLRQ